MLSLSRTQVQPLVRGLRCHKWTAQSKKKKIHTHTHSNYSLQSLYRYFKYVDLLTKKLNSVTFTQENLHIKYKKIYVYYWWEFKLVESHLVESVEIKNAHPLSHGNSTIKYPSWEIYSHIKEYLIQHFCNSKKLETI